MMDGFLITSLVVLSLAILGCLYRLIKGPSMNDRIIALDTIGILLLSMIAVLCMLFRTQVYFDIILLIGILTFIGTTALARYIERGDVIERDEPNR
ncbi:MULTISPECIES: Na(+)/H(+) antiporter subunit F1 [Paenibacillus]|uniref:Na(+)/H(+) antiporter subunit F n=1 Tax=Paenibacillus campinasensis TaxID=66347 RepID=A0A268EPK1_9BACL|nr:MULTISPECIES: Na(+)/H(+) antiporter subunit F1 [Paenibacillus]MUG67464.1 Na(+)/H(+) antiporter subunit F1 [Paenibacillus campinasensis]PAD75052.1 Na(+)/H(+) antiporter subunit F [Paenibacillus campinasensis]PAK50554.1 Na(+)/H(+) antiporter subunit F [Paenibacillus sp. 7541]